MPEPVRNREQNDCAICAVEYAARCFGVNVDREQLKRDGDYHPDTGSEPEVPALLLSYGLTVIRTYAALPRVQKDERTRGPDWSDPRCMEAVCRMFRHMLGAGFVGVTQTQVIDPWDHAVVVEAMDEQDTLTVVCSLNGRYHVSLHEFVMGHEHKHGTDVFWVGR